MEKTYKKLGHYFSDEDTHDQFTMQDYLLQCMYNGQLSSFKETIKEISSSHLCRFAVNRESLLRSSEIQAIYNELDYREKSLQRLEYADIERKATAIIKECIK